MEPLLAAAPPAPVSSAPDDGDPVPADLEVRPGSILFFDRPSWLQRRVEASGQLFRGAAIADERDGRAVFAMMGRSGFEVRDLADQLGRYRRISVVDAPECPCVDRVVAALAALPTGAGRYATSTVAVAGTVAHVRHHLPGLWRRIEVPVVGAAGAIADRAMRGSGRAMCSSFVHRLVAEHWCPGHDFRPTVLAGTPASVRARRVARSGAHWFVTPTDLWNAAAPARRRDLVIDGRPVAAASQPTLVGLR